MVKTTKKQARIIDQAATNNLCDFYVRFAQDMNSGKINLTGKCQRLNSCNARIYEIKPGTFALVSYSTVVAFIADNVGYDVLRMVYGYTATSASHIAKFFRKYDIIVTLRAMPLEDVK